MPGDEGYTIYIDAISKVSLPLPAVRVGRLAGPAEVISKIC